MDFKKPKTKDARRISVYLDDATLRRFRIASKTRGRTMNDIAVELILGWLRENDTASEIEVNPIEYPTEVREDG